MKLVRQPTKVTCGAACYAMITNCSIEKAIEVVGNKWTDIDTMLQHLNLSGPLIHGQPPINCTAIQYHQQPNGPGGHWTVWCKGKLYDPACITKLWPVFGYKIID